MTPEQRIAEFLRQRENQRGLDPEEICTVFTDPNADPAPLLTSDLRAVLARLEDVEMRWHTAGSIVERALQHGYDIAGVELDDLAEALGVGPVIDDLGCHRPVIDPGEPEEGPYCDADGEHWPCEKLHEGSAR